MVAAIALLTVQHLTGLLATAAFDATLALRTLPVIVAHARHHALRHFNAAGMHCL